MTSSTLTQRVRDALATVQNPRLGRDLVAAEMVKDLTVDDAGSVTFGFVLTREDPGSLVRDARKAVQAVAGVSSVKVKIENPSPPAGARPAASVPPPPTPDEMPALGKVLAISSGKGGVGKSKIGRAHV